MIESGSNNDVNVVNSKSDLEMELKKAQAALNKNQKNKWGKSTTTTNKSTAPSSDKKASLSDTKKI
jgi:hypothetical protein